MNAAARTSQRLADLADVALFAPLGLLARACHELPSLAAEGRARAEARCAAARELGSLAVAHGRDLISQRLAGREPVATPSPARTPVTETEAGTTADVSGAPLPAAADLAIDHYDSLAAAQVVDLLSSLTPDELDAVERYERAHRNRRTVIGKISQLRG